MLRIAFGLQLPAVANTKHRTTPPHPRKPSPPLAQPTAPDSESDLILQLESQSPRPVLLLLLLLLRCCAAVVASDFEQYFCLFADPISQQRKAKKKAFLFLLLLSPQPNETEKKNKKQKTRQNNNEKCKENSPINCRQFVIGILIQFLSLISHSTATVSPNTATAVTANNWINSQHTSLQPRR